MAATPPDIEQVLDQLREVLIRWHREDTLGEVAIVRGYHQWQVEERPKRKHEAVKRVEGNCKAIARR